MPVRSNIEFGSASLYFKGLDEPIPVSEGQATYEEEFTDYQEPYIKISQEPIEFTLGNVEFPRDWVLAECKECGYEFPVTEIYALLYGTKGWVCPQCALKKIVEDARKRSEKNELRSGWSY